jgi:hypothetical protein
MTDRKPLPTLVQIAKGEAEFEFYSDGKMQYRLWWSEHDDFERDPVWHEFHVPIPVADTGGGFFNPTMKGLELMRWARKELARLQEEAEMVAKAREEWLTEQDAMMTIIEADVAALSITERGIELDGFIKNKKTK